MKRSGIDHLSDIENKHHCGIVALTIVFQIMIGWVDARQITSTPKRDK